eukprot:GHUV01030765.1.p1 GENE.GHUV01030765.1~~GHUV01030765.1.p1  ORF type:complete len:319 (+),score=117.37 GHUV01030765.1:1405-2361(+)
MEGFNVPEPGDPGLDGPDTLRELYRALRGTQGDDPLADDMLWDGDFLTSQREFIQKQQEEQMLERLERRMGRVRAAPTTVMTDSGISLGGTAPSLAAVASVMKTGAKFMGLVGKSKPKGPAATSSSVSGGRPASAVAATRSVDGAATAVALPSQALEPLEAESVPASAAKVVLVDAAATPVTDSTGTQAAKAGALVLGAAKTSGTASSPVTPRLLTRLVTSLRGSPPGGKIGILVAEDDNKQAAAGTAATAAALAEQPPADGAVEVRNLKAAEAGELARWPWLQQLWQQSKSHPHSCSSHCKLLLCVGYTWGSFKLAN